MWNAYKWADTPEKKEHNKMRETYCKHCKSRGVEDIHDEETDAVYTFAAKCIMDLVNKKENK